MADVKEEKRPLIQRLVEDASSLITELIYEKVDNLLGAENQLFTMEFPARPLNPNGYQYDAVPIVQAGNGENLSVVYNTLLNNYVPKMNFLREFVTDKNHLGECLLTEISDVVFDENHQAEMQEKTKQNMRACESRALYGSGSVYPVQFQPADWFKALEPNLHPKDLTMSAEALSAEIKAKKKELRGTEQKLAELEQKLAELEQEAQMVLLPENSGDASDSTFMDVILSSETIQRKAEESSNSSVSQKTEDASKMEIGFRVMKMSIDRGQWFSPTAFVIAKNITIRIKVNHDEMDENKSYIESQSSSSGHCFGFSAKSASDSKNCSESCYVGARNDFIYIRIPGPQILGWFQQLVPLDMSEPYVPMERN